MPRVSKKKRFRGRNRWEVAKSGSSAQRASTSSNNDPSSTRASTPVIETASTPKRGSPSDKNEVSGNENNYRLIELSNLVSAVQSIHNCKLGGELQMSDNDARRYDSSSVIKMECSNCDTSIELQTCGNQNNVCMPQNSEIRKKPNELICKESLSKMWPVMNILVST